MIEVLTEKELCSISGHRTREGLKGWLNENLIPFVIAKNGWPRVHRKGMEKALGVHTEGVTESKPVEFNFDALR